ncbi:MAG: Gfo/Idh/MocA family protein [Sphaerochaetaceae bacterium]|jgi:predicted dehydrogenase
MNIGIIGLGEVAQLMHLPILSDMTERCSISAVSDVSGNLVEHITTKYGIPFGSTNGSDVIIDPSIDAVVILSPDQYHGQYVRQALEADKHVFVEKPATLTAEELEDLVEVHKRHPASIVMVGYMRRFAAPFLTAKEIMAAQPKKTEYLRFRDIICEAPFYSGQARKAYVPTDIPPEVLLAGRQRRKEQIDQAIGAQSTDSERTTYQALTGLGCHTLSAVRELFGLPKKIRSVTTSQDGRHLVITFDYGDFIGVYELVNDQDIVQFDAAIEIFQRDRKLKIKYETPYIRNQPLHLEVIESDRHSTKTTIYGPTYTDPFKVEMETFFDCIEQKRQPKTGLEDALEDLRLFTQIIATSRNMQ